MWSLARNISPFDELRRLQREMDSLLNGYTKEYSDYPAVNIWSNDNEVILQAEVPGLNANDINLTVSGDGVSIEGERQTEEEETENLGFHRRERGSGKFIRSFRLPYEVDSEKVEAKYENGILNVFMPKSEQAKPKKISVSAE